MTLVDRLRELLPQKRSVEFYAEKLGISEDEVIKLKKQIKKAINEEMVDEYIESVDNYYSGFSKIESKNEHIEKGTTEIKFHHTAEVLGEEEIWQETKMDKKFWIFSSVYHKKQSRGFLYTALFKKKQINTPEVFQETFTEFLKTYKPSSQITKDIQGSNNKISLIIPKQDAHFNKYDIYGKNNIDERFKKNYNSIHEMLIKAKATNTIDEVVYVVGSDQFNSEWTNTTTKLTPQQNIFSYQSAFQKICDHEVKVINTLGQYSNQVKIYFIPGNHDEFVGWHLINWLESYYRNDKSISFNTSIENTKYYRYNNTAIMFNHGDAIKPADLAKKFPIGFKNEWSLCDNYIIITGDLHTELSMDINGIKYYRVPQLSSAISKWDDKKGYTDSKAEATAFVITSNNGISDIYKDLF
jgi:UDP-2,3-diacylglucosamine pyrophosphatase LpxH